MVRHVLSMLARAKIFGNLETMVTHKGSFRVKRLQFGVNVTPKIFQDWLSSFSYPPLFPRRPQENENKAR